MTTPRFPARGTPEYWDFLEHWLMVERVDNDRQWRLLRRAAAQLSGLNPVQVLVNLNFANGSGSGRGSGSGSGSGSGTFNWPSGSCCFRFTCAGVLTCSQPNGTFTIRKESRCFEYYTNSQLNWFMASFAGPANSLFFDGVGYGSTCQCRYDRFPDATSDLCDGSPKLYRLAATDGFSTGWPMTITLYPIDCP